jgi:chromate transport protein ChrA
VNLRAVVLLISTASYRDADPQPLQMMILGLVPAVVGLLCDTLWGLGASAACT